MQLFLHTILLMKNLSVKACVRYFLSNFYFSPNDSPSNTMKNVFYFTLKALSFSRYSNFCVFVLPSFFPVSHCFKGWFKKNFKIDDVIICVNKNLITHFVRYVEKETRFDIETLSIDRVLKYGTFLWKNHAEDVHQKLAPDPFLILLNNPKETLHAGNSFENNKFWKMIIKKP